MKTYPINEARADFSKLVERALAGEPSRVTRYGKEAVVIVSEEEWRQAAGPPPNPRRQHPPKPPAARV